MDHTMTQQRGVGAVRIRPQGGRRRARTALVTLAAGRFDAVAGQIPG